MNPDFWRGRRIFVTGHTGFKGAWLCLLLQRLGAQVGGYALAPPTRPSLCELAHACADVITAQADVRDADRLAEALAGFAPEIVLHMAAQSVVLNAYEDPADTFSTNVMGTVNLFEAVRKAARPMAVVNVTTDKVYLNQRWPRGYRETDALGGRDPYSASKACSELVTRSYAESFFPAQTRAQHGVSLASARAGNVVGGGDWTPHQLVPAVIAAATAGQPVELRNPTAIRPWQHVLDCLHGYLTLCERLLLQPETAAGDWNFGPANDEVFTVAQVAEALARNWSVQPAWRQAPGHTPHEEHELRLDCGKAARTLGWRCTLGTATALDWVANWYRQVQDGVTPRQACESQIEAYLALRASAAPARERT